MSKRERKPERVSTEIGALGAPLSLAVEASEPQLWSIVFAREPLVQMIPEEDETDVNMRFTLWLGREHSRTITLEMAGILQGFPWVKERTILVAYRMFFVVRGPVSDEVVEAAIKDLALRVGPAVIFPFIRETMHSITSKTGNSLMLPIMDFKDRFSHIPIPEPQGEIPPDQLEALLQVPQ
jgi:hypothetical protein